MNNEEEYIEPGFMKQQEMSPFRVPDGYFDSFDDRIMKRIQVEGEKKSHPANFIRVLKPVLAVAASILLVYFVAGPYFTRRDVARKLSLNAANTVRDDSTFNYSLIDESTLVNAIFSDDKSDSEDVNSDDILAYLSSGLNEVQIYTAIQNNQ